MPTPIPAEIDLWLRGLMQHHGGPVNVVGYEKVVTKKQRGGVELDIECYAVYVRSKVLLSDLAERDRLPPAAPDGIPLDVRVVGDVKAGGLLQVAQHVWRASNRGAKPTTVMPLANPFAPGVFVNKVRPLVSGVSGGHERLLGAGTVNFGVLVNGLPGFLTNQHVAAPDGVDRQRFDLLLQPGWLDEGYMRYGNAVGFLTGWSQKDPAAHDNHLDAAWGILMNGFWPSGQQSQSGIATLLRRAAGGDVKGVNLEDVPVGTPAEFTGRTSGLVTLLVTAVAAHIAVDYGVGVGVVEYDDCYNLGPGSKPGDSGSLLLRQDTGQAFGLIFAGAPGVVSIACKLRYLPPEVRFICTP